MILSVRHRWRNCGWFGFWFLTIVTPAWSQQDSMTVLTEAEFTTLVLDNHPAAHRAELQLSRGAALRLAGRGGFDPKLTGDASGKSDQGTTYYRHASGELSIPAWFGLTVKTGFDRNVGSYLNPERTTPGGGLLSAGVVLSLGEGLMIDQRRANLFTARLMARSAGLEQTLMLNDLRFEAAIAYWDWALAGERESILSRAAGLARERLDGVRTGWVNGFRSAVDTLEAYLQWQALEQERLAADLFQQKARLVAGTFLWTESMEPLDLPDRVTAMPVPEPGGGDVIATGTWVRALAELQTLHPAILQADLKVAIAEVDQRLKAERLKPTLNLSYQLLAEPVGGDWIADVSPDNAKWGVTFSLPLFLRKERGDWQLSRVKVEEEQLIREQKVLEWRNKIRAYAAELDLAEAQVRILHQTVSAARQMLDAEQVRYGQGESSLFVLNARQMKLIETELKSLDARVKYRKAAAALRWALGLGTTS